MHVEYNLRQVTRQLKRGEWEVEYAWGKATCFTVGVISSQNFIFEIWHSYLLIVVGTFWQPSRAFGWRGLGESTQLFLIGFVWIPLVALEISLGLNPQNPAVALPLRIGSLHNIFDDVEWIIGMDPHTWTWEKSTSCKSKSVDNMSTISVDIRCHWLVEKINNYIRTILSFSIVVSYLGLACIFMTFFQFNGCLFTSFHCISVCCCRPHVCLLNSVILM